MNKPEIISGLTELANNLGVTIRKEKGIYTEGICTVNDKKIILLNKNSPVERVIFVLARSLAEIGLDDLYIKPILREVIDSQMQSKAFYLKGEGTE
jgi:hypothetical protein